MSTAVEQTAHYCKRYAVFCTGANERGECKTTACWNTSEWLHELLRRGEGTIETTSGRIWKRF